MKERVKMSTYSVLRSAIQNRQQVTCTYGGHHREICPHVIGRKGDQENVLAFQFDGSSSRGLPPEGEWRCMRVAGIEHACAQDGAWHTGHNHSQPQTCVDEIDIEVDY